MHRASTRRSVLRRSITTIPALLLATLLAGDDAVGQFGVLTYQPFPIDAAQEVPPNNSLGTGIGNVTFDTNTSTLSWNISYSGLTGPATAAHFHGPAPPGVNAGVQVSVGTANPAVGQAVLSAVQASQLQAGLWYFNVHTAMFPGGEIRGQVIAPRIFNWAGPPGPVHAWNDPNNWIPQGFPNGPNDVAVLGDVIVEDTTVTLDVPITIRDLMFGSLSHEYTLGVEGGNDLTFENPGIAQIIACDPGTTTLCGNVIHSCLLTEVIFGGTLLFAGDISGVAELQASLTLPPSNAGTVQLAGGGDYDGEVLVQGGTLRLSSGEAIPDSLPLIVQSPGQVCIDDGILEVVGELVLDGVPLPTGLYGELDSPLLKGTGLLLRQEPPWVHLYKSKLGSNGFPALLGVGPLLPGSPAQLRLCKALPLTTDTLIVGFDELCLPFKGGFLVPSPDLFIPLFTDGQGKLTLPFDVPPGLSGASVVFQTWIVDPGATKNLSASNGLQAVFQ